MGGTDLLKELFRGLKVVMKAFKTCVFQYFEGIFIEKTECGTGQETNLPDIADCRGYNLYFFS